MEDRLYDTVNDNEMVKPSVNFAGVFLEGVEEITRGMTVPRRTEERSTVPQKHKSQV